MSELEPAPATEEDKAAVNSDVEFEVPEDKDGDAQIKTVSTSNMEDGKRLEVKRICRQARVHLRAHARLWVIAYGVGAKEYGLAVAHGWHFEHMLQARLSRIDWLLKQLPKRRRKGLQQRLQTKPLRKQSPKRKRKDLQQRLQSKPRRKDSFLQQSPKSKRQHLQQRLQKKPKRWES
mgnify:CR=1 FL=1